MRGKIGLSSSSLLVNEDFFRDGESTKHTKFQTSGLCSDVVEACLWMCIKALTFAARVIAEALLSFSFLIRETLGDKVWLP